MPSLLNTTYPPEIDTFMPAFIYNETVRVFFSYSKYNTADLDSLNLHYVVVDQQTNESALNDASGIECVYSRSSSASNKIGYDQNIGGYYFDIPLSALRGKKDSEGSSIGQHYWKNNQYYKLQARFDSNQAPNEFKKQGSRMLYMNDMENQRRYFSEWSKVCLLRPIWEPDIVLTRLSVDEDDETSMGPTFTRGIIPIRGRLEFTPPEEERNTNEKESETLQSYQIVVIEPNTEKEVFRSEVIYTGRQEDMNDIYYDLDTQGFDEDDVTAFIMRIEYVTRNRYKGVQGWKMNVSEYVTMEDFNPRITVCLDNDEGSALIHITNEQTVFGILYIKRSDSRSNFKIWEDLKILIVGMDDSDSPGPIDLYIKDDTISSLCWYQYSVQLKNQNGGMSQLHRSDDVILPEFYDMFLLRDGRKVPVRYNYKITSFKPIVNRVKFDTLGGKYPKFAENAALNYKQFQITGLISAQADPKMDFLEKKTYFGTGTRGFYHDYLLHKTYEPTVWYDNKSTMDTDVSAKTIKNRIDSMYGADEQGECVMPGWLEEQKYSTDENYDFFWEREYRENLMAWLNDGEPKLYRSMTEGNMCVMIMDLSLTPNAVLGRRIWDFSATVYEVEDGYSLDKLHELGIIDKYTTLSRCLLADKRTSLSSGTECTLDDGRVVNISLEDPFVTIMKPGQVYVYSNDIQNMDIISQKIKKDLDYRYGGKYTGISIRNCVISDIKIFFHGLPRVYVQTSVNGETHLQLAGNIENATENEYTAENSPWHDNTDMTKTDILTSFPDPKNRYLIGYRFNLTWGGGNSGFEEIFVPYRPDGMIPYRFSYPRDIEVPVMGEYLQRPVHGYYTIPSSMTVSTLTFPDSAGIYGDQYKRTDPQKTAKKLPHCPGLTPGYDPVEVTVEYVIRYEEHTSSEVDTVSTIDLVKRIVGQQFGPFAENDPLADDIFKKYAFDESDEDGVKVTREMQFWYGVCIETDPYALVSLKYYRESGWNNFMVGGTGVLHLLKDEKLDDIMFTGRQMFEKPTTTQTLRDWEYKIYCGYVRDIGDIKHPRENHVYQVDGTGESYIYYHTKFYPFDILKDNITNENLGIGIAHVPINGHVEYLADILRVTRVMGDIASGESG